MFSKAELELVADLCQKHDVLCVSDEVYQWLVYDGHQHVSIGESGQPQHPRTPEQGLSPSWEQRRPGDQAPGLWSCALVRLWAGTSPP